MLYYQIPIIEREVTMTFDVYPSSRRFQLTEKEDNVYSI